ncbi:unnamed protein product [Closterium sp. NIES-65]|nr:unnamed protein product [Closterium sp. NIES-65]
MIRLNPDTADRFFRLQQLLGRRKIKRASASSVVNWLIDSSNHILTALIDGSLNIADVPEEVRNADVSAGAGGTGGVGGGKTRGNVAGAGGFGGSKFAELEAALKKFAAGEPRVRVGGARVGAREAQVGAAEARVGAANAEGGGGERSILGEAMGEEGIAERKRTGAQGRGGVAGGRQGGVPLGIAEASGPVSASGSAEPPSKETQVNAQVNFESSGLGMPEEFSQVNKQYAQVGAQVGFEHELDVEGDAQEDQEEHADPASPLPHDPTSLPRSRPHHPTSLPPSLSHHTANLPPSLPHRSDTLASSLPPSLTRHASQNDWVDISGAGEGAGVQSGVEELNAVEGVEQAGKTVSKGRVEREDGEEEESEMDGSEHLLESSIYAHEEGIGGIGLEFGGREGGGEEIIVAIDSDDEEEVVVA